MGLKHRLHLGNLVFDPGGILDYRALRTFLVVVNHGVHQHIQAGTLSGRYRYNRNGTQHLRKAVQIDFHPAILHDIHHIQSEDYRFLQFQKLKGQIKISFQ